MQVKSVPSFQKSTMYVTPAIIALIRVDATKELHAVKPVMMDTGRSKVTPLVYAKKMVLGLGYLWSVKRTGQVSTFDIQISCFYVLDHLE